MNRRYKSMKVLVTGITGQLGHDVMLELMARGHKALGTARSINGVALPLVTCAKVGAAVDPEFIQLDLTDEKTVKAVIEKLKPDVIIHCAAWTNVDGAEDPGNLSAVRKINVDSTKTLAYTAKLIGAKFVYISTDYVFNGLGENLWQPDETNFEPLNVYGQSKLDGERAVVNALEKYFIVRTAWVFGLNGKNFIKTMINVGKTHDSVRVVNDQIGTPTYTKDLARLLVDMIETDKYGYYHATNEGGYISWYDFCCEIYRQYGLKTKVIPVSTAEYQINKAIRPYNSRLDRSKLREQGFEPLPVWQDAVKRYLEEAQL